jgi:hypothetical protein
MDRINRIAVFHFKRNTLNILFVLFESKINPLPLVVVQRIRQQGNRTKRNKMYLPRRCQL